MHYEIHNKKLPIPSFFQVYNFGGGRGDKDREIVYSEFTKDTPALINYYYINNEYPHEFQYKIFDDLSGYDTVGGIIELVYIVLQSVVKPGITGFFKIDLHIKCYIYLS